MTHLRAAGAARSVELQDACRVSQPTISRAMTPLLASGQLQAVGNARARVYVMPRNVAGVSSVGAVRVTQVNEVGGVSPFASLVPVVGGRYWIAEEAGPSALTPGLPWFLSDMRPQGFLGRAFAHANPDLRLGTDPTQWSDDDVLRALCAAGDDLPGNLIVGADSFDRYQRVPPPASVEPDRYPALAEAAMHGSLPGSSAGGEQPKFCCVRDLPQRTHMIVKFSPAGRSPAEQRWRDLLICEHLALQALDGLATADGQRVPAAQSEIHKAAGRVFLEVRRFDRTERGRVGMVSLLAYDSEYVGQIDNWADTAARMASRDLLVEEDARRLRFLEAFGRLIGNTDRHYGNISLLIVGDDWRMAPAYDVLPMLYAPTAGELVPREFDPGTLTPTVETLAQWEDARTLATQYWGSVADDQRVSDGFRGMAEKHAAQLKNQAPREAAAVAQEPPVQYERPS